MLTPIAKKDVPSYRGRERPPLRVFARQTLEEFLEVSKKGDVAEVTGAPEGCCPRGVASIYSALTDEMYAMWRAGLEPDPRSLVRVMTRGKARVFLERVQ